MSEVMIDLMRHGALHGGRKYRGSIDDPLTSEGEAAMDGVWQHLMDDVDAVLTSPLQRCRMMSERWQAAHGVPCHIEPRLHEMHYGEWEGLTEEQIRAAYGNELLQRWRDNPAGMCPPGGEAFEDFRQRIATLVDDIQQRKIHSEHRHLLMVAHSGTVRMLLMLFTGMDAAHIRRFDVPYACWSRIAVRPEGSFLVFHNRQAG